MSGISNMMRLNLVYWTCIVFMWSVAAIDDNRKNHRAEKRQDDSFLFFGGWRPVRPGNSHFHGSASTKFHDILSALPNSYDSSSSYYTHAMPSRYQKDIYNYYPRPAIKSAPKKNTPVYMERYRPQKQQQKHRSRGVSNHGPQFMDLQNIDLKHLQNIDFKHLQDLIQQAKELPLSHLNLPVESGKPLKIVEVSLQSLQQGSQNYQLKNNNGYGGFRNAQRNNKGGYRKNTQNRIPAQSPVQYEYISFPKVSPILPQTLPKEVDITSIQLPHSIPSVEDIGIKNIQFVEVPVPAHIPYGINNNKGNRDSQYGKSGGRFNQPQYRAPSQNSQQTVYTQSSYFSQQAEKPRKHYAPSQEKANNIQTQPDIEAELIKLSEEELKHLLSNLQILDKSPHDLLKNVGNLLGNIGNFKDENVQLVLSLPEAGYNAGENSPVRSYDTHKSVQQSVAYGNEEQYGGQPRSAAYQSKGTSTYSSGYKEENHESYQSHEHNAGGYQVEEQSPRSNNAHYEQSDYQSVDSQSGYDQTNAYHKDDNQEPQSDYDTNSEEYSKPSPEASKEQQGSYGQREQSYIEVISPQTDENGYRREPVLAVEIQHGQSIEDAIKSLDPETLKKLGTHGENGIEIEVVEVPIDEYASESKKTETVVSAKNSTVTLKKEKAATKS